MARMNYVVCIHGWDFGKVSVVFNRNCFLKMKDFSRLGDLQACRHVHGIRDSIKEIVLDTLLLHTCNRIWLIYSCHFQLPRMTLTVIRVMM